MAPYFKSIKNSGSRFYLALSLVAILIGCMFFITIPGNTIFTNALQNSGHALLFAGISALLISILRWINYPKPLLLTQYVLVLFISCCIGMFVEVLQSYIGRDASWTDLILDMMGAIAGLFLMSPAKINTKSGAIYKSIGLLILIISFAKPLTWAFTTWDRNKQFPIIGGFDSLMAQRFYQGKNSATFHVVSSPEKWQSNMGKVGLVKFSTEQKWSGFTNIEPYADWRGYKTFSFEIYSEEKKIFNISLKINDKSHNNDFQDRFNHGLSIKPGLNHFSFSLLKIELAPANRKMDLANISNISWFIKHTPYPFTIYIDNIKLQ